MRSGAPASRGSLASLRRPACSVMLHDEEKLSEGEREDLERWKRCYSTVVKRDIPRQQKGILTQSREATATLKRTVTAAQKEVRRRAMRAQRMASGSQVQLRCKKLSRELQLAYKVVEARLLDRRKEEARDVWHARSAAAIRTSTPAEQHPHEPQQAKRARRSATEKPLDVTLIRAPLGNWQRRLVDSIHVQLLAYGNGTTLGPAGAGAPVAVGRHVGKRADAEVQLAQTRLLLELRAVSAHPRLLASPPSPAVLLPFEHVRFGLGATPDPQGRLEVAPGCAAVNCIIPSIAWEVYKSCGATVGADELGRCCRELASCMLLWGMRPTWLVLCRFVQAANGASMWTGTPSLWLALLLIRQAPALEKVVRALSVAQPRAFCRAPQLVEPCFMPCDPRSPPAAYPTRRAALFAKLQLDREAAFRRELASALNEPPGDAVGCGPSLTLPALGTAALLSESGKLAKLDELLQRMLSAPSASILLFCHCSRAAELVRRLLVFRRIAHAYVPEALPAAQRSLRVQAARQAASHVLLFQGDRPTLNLKALPSTAIIFDQDPAQSLLQSLGSEAASLHFFCLVSADRPFAGVVPANGWEETAVTFLSEPPSSLAVASARLLQAECARATSRVNC